MTNRQSLMRQSASAELAIQIVLDSLDSPHSKRAYERHLREFIAWFKATGQSESRVDEDERPQNGLRGVTDVTPSPMLWQGKSP